MKLNSLKNTAGNTIASVVVSISIAGALVPQVVDIAQKAAAAENAGRLNSAASFYHASGGKINLGADTESVIRLLQSDAPIPGFIARGPFIHQQDEPQFANVGWRVIRHAESGDFKVIHSKEEGQPGFIGF